MNPYLKYRQANSFSWTRIDMLLLVYEKAVNTLQEGVRLLEDGRLIEMSVPRMTMQRVIMTITDGLNTQVGESPAQIARLCLYVLEQTQTNSTDAWKSALEVMQTIRSAFEEIQDQAREAECAGEIPALDVIAR